MTPERLAYSQREFLILIEKASALVIAAEFEALKREMFLYFSRTLLAQATLANLYAKNYLERSLLFFDNYLGVISAPFSSAVERAQRRMINFTGNSLKRYLPEIRTSIFEPDADAIEKLIGRTQDGKSLDAFFRQMRAPLGVKAKESLIEGFSRGESVSAIAKRISDVADVGQYRALVISRNETVMAYRNASAEFYDRAGITRYRFISSLDPRTCLICWRLHGTVWKLKRTPHIHTQCRCSVVPVLRRDGKIKTGVELFAKLETGFQKQILGPSRFKLFQNGGTIPSFVGAKTSKDFGKTYFIKPLQELKESGFVFKSSNDAARKYYGAGRLSHPQEWRETIDYLRREGVDVRTEGSSMVYGAASRQGVPGNLRIDPDASISALRHETYHYEHDKARSFPGMRYYFERFDKRWESEFFAYMVELNFAREMKNPALAREIIGEMREARRDLRSFYGISEIDRKR